MPDRPPMLRGHQMEALKPEGVDGPSRRAAGWRSARGALRCALDPFDHLRQELVVSQAPFAAGLDQVDAYGARRSGRPRAGREEVEGLPFSVGFGGIEGRDPSELIGGGRQLALQSGEPRPPTRRVITVDGSGVAELPSTVIT